MFILKQYPFLPLKNDPKKITAHITKKNILNGNEQ